ncbi:Ankyrin repeat protein [Pelomyxa schiedti]|nr:Ankyrin repeat protein [Pelomyxa schiedti]
MDLRRPIPTTLRPSPSTSTLRLQISATETITNLEHRLYFLGFRGLADLDFFRPPLLSKKRGRGGVVVRYGTKTLGTKITLRSVKLRRAHRDVYDQRQQEAVRRVLHDVDAGTPAHDQHRGANRDALLPPWLSPASCPPPHPSGPTTATTTTASYLSLLYSARAAADSAAAAAAVEGGRVTPREASLCYAEFVLRAADAFFLLVPRACRFAASRVGRDECAVVCAKARAQRCLRWVVAHGDALPGPIMGCGGGLDGSNLKQSDFVTLLDQPVWYHFDQEAVAAKTSCATSTEIPDGRNQDGQLRISGGTCATSNSASATTAVKIASNTTSTTAVQGDGEADVSEEWVPKVPLLSVEIRPRVAEAIAAVNAIAMRGKAATPVPKIPTLRPDLGDVQRNTVSKLPKGCFTWRSRLGALQCACENGDLEMCKRVVDMLDITADWVRYDSNCALRAACEGGFLEIADWLVNRFSLGIGDMRGNGDYILKRACQNGHLQIAKWLDSKFDIHSDPTVCSVLSNACQGGNMAMVEWVATAFPLSRLDVLMAFDDACSCGWLDIASFLVTTFSLTCTETRHENHFALRYACKNNHFAVVKWLCESFQVQKEEVCEEKKAIPRAACASGNIALVEYMCTKYKLEQEDICSKENQALRHACRDGRLHLAQWLTTTFHLTRDDATSRGCDALRSACANGHLEVAKWLVGQFTLIESIPVPAGDPPAKAVVGGYYGGIPGEVACMRAALFNKHQDVVVWLFEVLWGSDKEAAGPRLDSTDMALLAALVDPPSEPPRPIPKPLLDD